MMTNSALFLQCFSKSLCFSELESISSVVRCALADRTQALWRLDPGFKRVIFELHGD
jgi:hypothetical protein